jgi:hypothetical protein
MESCLVNDSTLIAFSSIVDYVGEIISHGIGLLRAAHYSSIYVLAARCKEGERILSVDMHRRVRLVSAEGLRQREVARRLIRRISLCPTLLIREI